jgi:hypothetical protein
MGSVNCSPLGAASTLHADSQNRFTSERSGSQEKILRGIVEHHAPEKLFSAKKFPTHARHSIPPRWQTRDQSFPPG